MGSHYNKKRVPLWILFLGIFLAFWVLVIIWENRSIKNTVYIRDEDENQEKTHYIFRPIHSFLKRVVSGIDDKYDVNKCYFENYVFGQPVQQDDPCLISSFKSKLLVHPPPLGKLDIDDQKITDQLPSNIEKLKWIEKLIIENPTNAGLGNRLPGFFIECGANDGEFISPTFRLEKKYNWKGLLIEANPIPFKKLLEKKRNCWAANVAVCTSKHPQQITFYTNPNSTGLSGLNERKEHGVTVNQTLQCIPLYTMLAALDIQKVDYFSLDVEGLELEILKTVPFDKIKFKVLTVEYGLIPGKQKALKDFLEPRGYRFVKEIRDGLTQDCLYVHETLYDLASSTTI